MKIDPRMSSEWQEAITRQHKMKALIDTANHRNLKRKKRKLKGIWVIRNSRLQLIT